MDSVVDVWMRLSVNRLEDGLPSVRGVEGWGGDSSLFNWISDDGLLYSNYSQEHLKLTLGTGS